MMEHIIRISAFRHFGISREHTAKHQSWQAKSPIMLQQLDTDHDGFLNDEIKKLLHGAEQRLKQAASLTESSPARIKPASFSTNPQAASSYKHETPTMDIQDLG